MQHLRLVALLWTSVKVAAGRPIKASRHIEVLSASFTPLSCDFTHLHPRRYAALHLPPSPSPNIQIDGVLDDESWTEVPWSEPFQDIRGLEFWSQPWYSTKVKLRYDQQFLYVGAYIEESEVWANLSQRNEVIFHDNDFEIFVDTDGTTHNYKEFEVNARNATWNLWLNRPYRDDGHENSTRVDPQYGFDMLNGGMRSEVFVRGAINDPSERLYYWTVEIALPLKDLASHTSATVPPTSNSFWRINFSRVEWPVRVVTDGITGKQQYEKKAGLREENWVWSAQYAVDMHRPEWWGYLQFRPQKDFPSKSYETHQHIEEVPLDPEWNIRYLSFQLYYAQHVFYKARGTYASSLEQLLSSFTTQDISKCINLIDMSSSEKMFTAHLTLKTFFNEEIVEFVSTIKEDGYIVVEKVDSKISAW